MTQIKPNPATFWLNHGVLTTQEINFLRKANYNVTEFIEPINTNLKASIEAAIETIQEHHFAQSIWVEHVCNL